MAEAIAFKYRLLDSNGQVTGFLSKRGSFDGQTLVLDKQPITVEAVIRAMRRFNRLMIIFHGETDELAVLTLAIHKGDIGRLHSSLNMFASEAQARRRLDHLESTGQAEKFRVETCPHCQATIDMTGFPASPQVHCPYCDVIGTLEQTVEDEEKFSHCDQCELFAQAKEFTAFFFYFLIVLYGYSHRQMFICRSCMRRQAWKMFFSNLIFLLGVPVSLVQICRAHFGRWSTNPAFAGLNRAATLYSGKRYDQASGIYEQLAGQISCCAGVHYNHGMAEASAGRIAEAATQFELALQDCANYARAADALYGCYNRLGRHEDAEAVRCMWTDEPDEDHASDESSQGD